MTVAGSWTLTEQVLLGVMAAVWLYQLYFYFRFILAAVRRTKGTQTTQGKEETDTSSLPGVSVIVCAKNEEVNLRDNLQALMTQDYPVFEVIVVNDGSVDNTELFLDYWQKRYSNLKLTFVPQGARVGSTKKLAITLGAKAAQYDYLLLTDADCRPESTRWIREMLSGFRSPETQIVLGAGMYFRKRGLLNRLVQFDTLFTALQYLGLAACGYPYMGVGRNLAYRKQLFFEHGGFVGLMNNRAGDDDLFVNREATTTNTTVVCTPESLTWSVPKLRWRDWFRQKRRHLSVATKYKASTRLQLLLEPLTRGVLYAMLIALLVLGTWQTQLIALTAMLLRWIAQCVLMNTAADRWGTTKIILLIPVWEILLPLVTLVLMLIEPLRPKPTRW